MLLNLAVAWTLAIVRPGNDPDTGFDDELSARLDDEDFTGGGDATAQAWSYLGGFEFNGEGIGWEFHILEFSNSDQLQFNASETAPELIRSVPMPDVAQILVVSHNATGWPLPAFRGAVVARSGPSTDDTALIRNDVWRAVLVPFGAWTMTDEEKDYTPYDEASRVFYGWDTILPLSPIWPGFVVNTVFYALVLGGLFFGPGAIKRARRRKRGLCPVCAYPLKTDGDVCSECGAPLRGESVESRE